MRSSLDLLGQGPEIISKKDGFRVCRVSAFVIYFCSFGQNVHLFKNWGKTSHGNPSPKMSITEAEKLEDSRFTCSILE